jgi:hypothetical protein
MYVQITTKCNFSCKHCCFACGPNGKHMSKRVFEATLKTFGEDSLSIGGGEPTLHPHFWEFLALAIGSAEYVWLATNGSQTEIALILAKMAHKGVISCALSQDEYHDPIDPRVVAAFTKTSKPYSPENIIDRREIRTVTKSPDNLTLFRDPKAGGDSMRCPCSDYFITPSGKVRFCGCRNAPVIGDVFKSITKPKGSEDYECWNDYLRAEKIK